MHGVDCLRSLLRSFPLAGLQQWSHQHRCLLVFLPSTGITAEALRCPNRPVHEYTLQAGRVESMSQAKERGAVQARAVSGR